MTVAYYRRALAKLAAGEKGDGCLDLHIAKEKGSKEAKKKIKEICK